MTFWHYGPGSRLVWALMSRTPRTCSRSRRGPSNRRSGLLRILRFLKARSPVDHVSHCVSKHAAGGFGGLGEREPPLELGELLLGIRQLALFQVGCYQPVERLVL